MHRKLYHTLLCAVCVGAETASALTDAWSVDVNAHTAVQRTYKQGESIDMRISLRDGLKPLDLTGATARWFWYTNTTANVWWTNSVTISAPKAGLVTASWTPAMDCGAASYPYWIGIWTAGSTSPLWRVTGTIRMLPSPGFTPNALPMPIRTLDFAAVALTNAPWATTNALAGAVQTASETNALFNAWFVSLFSLTSRWESAYGWGDWHSAVAQKLDIVSTNGWEVGSHASFVTTQQLDEAVAGIVLPPSDRITTPDGSQWIDATGGVWRVESVIGPNHVVFYTSPGAYTVKNGITNYPPASQIVPFPTDGIEYIGAYGYMVDTSWLVSCTKSSVGWAAYWTGELPLELNVSGDAHGSCIVDWALVPVTNHIGTVALSDQTVNPTNGTAHNLFITGTLKLNGATVSTSPTLFREGVTYRQVWDTNLQTTAWEPLP